MRVEDNRQIHKDMAAGMSKNMSSPFNEAFSFTPDEYAALKRFRPALFDPDTKRRQAAWVAWSQTSEGKAFRVR